MKMKCFEEYKNNPDKAVRKRAAAWRIAAEQSKSDTQLANKEIDLIKQEIEGKITMLDIVKYISDEFDKAEKDLFARLNGQEKK